MISAEYYINKVFREIETLDEAIALSREVDEWEKTADREEIRAFCDSGAGEMLYMMCEE